MTGQINVNKIAARTGNTITINSGDKISGAAGSIVQPGMILQTKSFTTSGTATTTSTSFVDTGLFAAQFDNALQANSQVFVIVHANIGQPYDGGWAKLNYITILDGSTDKGAASNLGIGGGAPLGGSWAGTGYIQYDTTQITGTLQFTPSSNNPTIKLAYRSHTNGVGLRIGGNYNYGSSNYHTTTKMTIQEIAG